MPNTRISSLSEDTTPADDDLVATVDVSDTTQSAQGSTKKVQAQNLVVKKLRTSTGPAVLTVGAVADGEFLKRSGTSIISAAAGGGGLGDVVGPASAADEALARFDTTTGKLIQNSAVTIDDNGAVTVPEIAAPGTPAAGKVAVYAKADGKLYIKDDTGAETDLTAAGSGSPNPTSTVIPYNNAGSFADSPLVREDADTVGLYDISNTAENPSRLNIYGLKNGATFERLSIYYNTADDRYVLDVNHSGSTARDLQIRMNGTPFWQIEDNGAITAASDTASVMRVGNGTSSAPGLQFSTSPTGNNQGFTFSAGPFVNTITGGAKRFAVHDFGAVIGSGSRFGFSSTSLESGTAEDVAFERDAAGRAAVVDASVSHNPRDLKLRACLHNADTFANRPGTPVTGMVITVTDSTVNTFGATVAGGGGNTVLAWYNGTNWTVIGV